jgi:hypothetical protein
MNIILIEKDGTIIEKNVKIPLDKLYSVCGYRTNKDFEKLSQWNFDSNIYELYGKKNGKKEKENNFVIPQKSITTNTKEKYYGTLCIIKNNGSITLDEWNIFYMSFTNILSNITDIMEKDEDTYEDIN